MDAFTNLATQATLANLMDQLKLLTNQLQNIQFHNAKFEANDAQIYPTMCRYCDGCDAQFPGGPLTTRQPVEYS